MKMKLKMSRAEIWSATIEDRVGGANFLLELIVDDLKRLLQDRP